MLHFLPAPILGTITATLVILHTLFWAIPLHVLALAKLLVPLPGWRRLCTRSLIWLIEVCWVNSNRFVMGLMLNIEWEMRGLTITSRDEWYFVSSNHQTWLDIFVLLQTLNRRIPFPRFFLKRELLWVPVVGLTAWALDMPFMRRYSREFLRQHPELRGKDLETTRKAIEKFGDVPVSILNFLEGTRFTPAKHAKQESPYTHLLRPKAGGIAFVLGSMGEKFDALLDVTIIYPEGQPSAWKFVSGQMSRVIVQVDKLKIPPQFLEGDYMNDPAFRKQFQGWVRDLWEQKDARIEATLAAAPLKT